ncbi:MAG: DUF6789 family protein [Geminicoccaceae bacterium]
MCLFVKGKPMSHFAKGLIAGLAATLVLSALMIMKQLMGIMPELDIAAMLTSMLGLPSIVLGWAMHFVIGTVVWGMGYAIVRRFLPGGPVVSGAVFGIGAWVMMMVAVMPMAGAGLFGLELGIMAPVMTFVLHVVFGAVLGFVFHALNGTRSSAHAA